MPNAESLTLALLEQLPGAVAVLDVRVSGFPVVLANAGLAQLAGRSREALCGLGLAALLGEPAGGARLGEVTAAIGRGGMLAVRVPTVAGVPGTVAADVRFEPLKDDAGTVTHYVAFHDPAAVADAEEPPRPPLPRDDRLTGLRHIEFFHELFRRDFAIAQREGRTLALFVCDIDALGVYNDTFGRQAGDSVIRRTGRALSGALRRASDLVARVEAGRFLGLAAGMDAEHARRHAETLAARVRELHMHHPRSPVARIVTISVGVAQLTPGPESTPEQLLKDAQDALLAARAAGGNRVADAARPAP